VSMRATTELQLGMFLTRRRPEVGFIGHAPGGAHVEQYGPCVMHQTVTPARCDESANKAVQMSPSWIFASSSAISRRSSSDWCPLTSA